MHPTKKMPSHHSVDEKPDRPKLSHQETIDTVSNSCNRFSKLPRPILLHIVAFLKANGPRDGIDFRTLIALASCDTFFQTLICRELTFLWQHIDIDASWGTWTDTMLHSFLVRVDAKHVTKTLIVKDLTVSGEGLIPLTGSRVLEYMDVRVASINPRFNSLTRLNDKVVAKVLTSMLDLNLRVVRHNGGANPHNHSPSFGLMLNQLGIRHLNRLELEQTKCSFCDCNLVESARTFGRTQTRGANTLTCGDCNQTSCNPWTGRRGCPNVVPCSRCDVCSCDNCQTSCIECYNSLCQSCSSDAVECENLECSKSICLACLDSTSFLTLCSSCCAWECHSCRYGTAAQWRKCSRCRDVFCFGCYLDGDLDICECCGGHYCADCDEIIVCNNEHMFCEDCVAERSCAGCNTSTSCPKCLLYECDSCEKQYCSSCFQSGELFLDYCTICDGLYDGCQDFYTCSPCGAKVCGECCAPSTSTGTGASLDASDKEMWKMCGCCDKIICNGCSSNCTCKLNGPVAANEKCIACLISPWDSWQACTNCNNWACPDCAKQCGACLESHCEVCDSWTCKTKPCLHECPLLPSSAKRQKCMHDIFVVPKEK